MASSESPPLEAESMFGNPLLDASHIQKAHTKSHQYKNNEKGNGPCDGFGNVAGRAEFAFSIGIIEESSFAYAAKRPFGVVTAGVLPCNVSTDAAAG